MSWARTGPLWLVRDRRSGLAAYVSNRHTKARQPQADANRKMRGRGLLGCQFVPLKDSPPPGDNDLFQRNLLSGKLHSPSDDDGQ